MLLAVSTQTELVQYFVAFLLTEEAGCREQEALGLGWKAKRTILETPLEHASLIVVGADGATAVAPPEE